MIHNLKKTSVLLLFLALVAGFEPTVLLAQEFNCRVTVNYRQLTGSSFEFLGELQERIEDYFNEYQWTEDRYLQEERLDCNVQIIFQESLSLTSFRAQLIAELRRPIYGTSQASTVVRLNDQNWQFQYAQGDPLINDPEQFNAFTSVMDFYAYVLLGYDYDTFGELGGAPHFRRAQRIAELAQAQGAIGWDQIGSGRSRTELISQLMDPRFQPLRKVYFDYHFHGLDHFILRPDEARNVVLDAIGEIQSLYELVARQYAIDLFFDTKYQELAAVFDRSNMRNTAYQILSELDPSHLTQYNSLID